MSEKAELRRKLYAYRFAILELTLFLDTHPTNAKALELLREYRRRYSEALAIYEEKYGNLVITQDDAKAAGRWDWIDGPWPWENNFTEG